MANLLSDTIYLPVAIEEAVYLRGILRRSVRKCSEGDERTCCESILRRLENVMVDSDKYNNKPF